MRTKFTPGPWLASGDGTIAVDERLVCDVEIQSVRDKEGLANTLLISAAPDLYRVVESVFLQGLTKDKKKALYDHIYKAASAAIHKAQGGAA